MIQLQLLKIWNHYQQCRFIDDLSKAAVDLTTNDNDYSSTFEQLLTNEMNLINKIKNNIPDENDSKHKNLVADIMKVINN